MYECMMMIIWVDDTEVFQVVKIVRSWKKNAGKWQKDETVLLTSAT